MDFFHGRCLMLVLIALLLSSTASLYMTPNAGAGGLVFSPKTIEGQMGETVTFTVAVKDAPNTVEALGLDVFFDPNVLQFIAWTKGDLVAAFDFFDCNPIGDNVVRIGGVEASDDKILAGAYGNMVSLDFKVIGTRNAVIEIRNMKDNLSGWSTEEGIFAFEDDLQPQNESGGGNGCFIDSLSR